MLKDFKKIMGTLLLFFTKKTRSEKNVFNLYNSQLKIAFPPKISEKK